MDTQEGACKDLVQHKTLVELLRTPWEHSGLSGHGMSFNVRQSQSTIQKSKNHIQFPPGSWGGSSRGFPLPAGDEEEQRKPEKGEKEQAAEARSPSWSHLLLLQVSSVCVAYRSPLPAWSALKGQAVPPHFSFFSSLFDADASVDSSLDSVTAAGSLGLDSS